MSQPVGIVAGSAEGAALCYRTLCRCTETPLILEDSNSPLPTLDSTRLLAQAALRRAIQSL